MVKITPLFLIRCILLFQDERRPFSQKWGLPPKLPNKCPCFDEILCKFCFYWSWTLRQRENRAVLTAWELVVNGTSSSRRRQQQRYSFARNAAAAVYWCQFLRLIVNAKKKVCPTTVTIRQKKTFLPSLCFFLVYLCCNSNSAHNQHPRTTQWFYRPQ